jgi:drug/metabolite transporter (DMT)-like permease
MTAEVPLVACVGVLYLNEPLGWRLVAGSSLIFGCGVGLSLLSSRASDD